MLQSIPPSIPPFGLMAPIVLPLVPPMPQAMLPSPTISVPLVALLPRQLSLKMQ